jgi:hydrogenase-4 component B
MAREFFLGGLIAYLLGALAGFISLSSPRRARLAAFSLALTGAVLEIIAAGLALSQPETAAWNLPSALPTFSWTVRLTALSGFFNMALATVAAAVSVFSFGYLRQMEGRRNVGALGLFYNLVLLSLTLVFAAADAFCFLVAWEVMALSAYCLIVFEHEKPEARRSANLFFIMSHAGTGLLTIAFLLLAKASGGMDFAGFHQLASKLSPLEQSVIFLLFLVGFGVKAGIVPIHVWLPAAHPVAPSNISALMSGIVIKSGIYGMALVFFDFFDVPPLWAGKVVLAVGVVSALIGVLYALMEHDLKRLLAYHSIENIGIILIGFGAALLFRALGHPQLAALALIAGLYHTLNHAIFKCLLFLGAGSILHSTGTRNMEEMGGLIRRMPVTALCFLTGAIAISGLPPLNGFVSEWLTYQALLGGFGSTQTLTRLAFPIAGALLALTAALAAACFVKAFGISFLALPRSEHAARAHEVTITMRISMGFLSALCVVLGLGAGWILPIFDPITQQLVGGQFSAALLAGNGFVLAAGAGRAGSISPAAIAAMLVLLTAIPAAFYLAWGRLARRDTGPTWDCGLPGLTAENEYTATGFSKPIRMIFSALFRPRREIHSEFDVSPYYPTAIRFESEIERPIETHIYGRFHQWVYRMAGRMRSIQAGSIHAYLAYIFLTLIALLLFGARP